MVGDSSGHREHSPSKGIHRKASTGDLTSRGNGDNGAQDSRNAVTRATELGRLDSSQAEALSDLLSRVGLLGFESRRIISVMVANIALEGPTSKRKELVLQLREYLEGDGLARDLVPVLCGAFALD